MSEPVTNAEIEDVLSAVRRLVSENGGSKSTEASEEARGKLVLTPAFRVDPKTEEAAAEDAVEEAPDTVESLVLDAVQAAPLADVSDETSDETAEDDDEPVTNLESRIAELEAVVNQSAKGDYEPDGSEAPDIPDSIPFHHSDARPLRVTQPVETPDERDASAEAEIEPETGAAVDAEPETAQVKEPASDWEDVEPAADEFKFRAGAAEAEAETPEDAAAEHDDLVDAEIYAGEAADESYEADEAADDDFVVDEDMLREIVARLVREELQGAMGERITRNLRRMVRREIARAMALRDMD